MGEIKSEEIGKLKIGSYIMMEGIASKLTKIDKSAPGKHGHAKYRIEAIGLLDEQKRATILSGHAKVDVPVIEKKNAQVLAVSGSTAQMMDMESYETFDAPIPEELKDKVIAGTTVLYWDITGTRVIKQMK